MPALKRCSSCPELVPKGTGKCSACTKASDTRRGTASQRGYTGKGHTRRFRPGVLAKHPICVRCRAARSTVADHWPLSRRELVEQGMDPNDPKHGRGLCHRCHSIATAEAQPGGWNHGA